ncbi:MAG TPA: hypothetical protein VMJ10_23535 [Kofleriaceae bacterium]|nr:hypothetical protein [Kofleriaceae bacterium]
MLLPVRPGRLQQSLADIDGSHAVGVGRLAGPLDGRGFGGREGARTRLHKKDQQLVREGQLSSAEFKKREAERERIRRLDQARLQK